MKHHQSAQSGISRRGLLQAGGALLAAPWLVTACGGNGSGGSGSGRLTVGTILDINNFDPYNQSISSLVILRLLNGWLANYNQDLEPEPDALENFEIAPDRTSVTLRIRDDVVFTTGKTMTVDDIVFGFERAADPERGVNLVSPMSIVDDFRATNDREVVLTFREPTNTSLIHDLLVHQPVVDSDHNSVEGLSGEPASAGPFRVADWNQGANLRLEANPDWYQGEVASDEIEIQLFDSAAALVSALQSGSADVVPFLPPNHAERVQGDHPITEGYPGAAIQLLRVSTLTEPFTDRTLRQMLQRSIDRERIVDEVLYGFGGSANLPWGPESPAYDSDFAEQTAFNLDEAERLLQSTDAPNRGTAMVSGSDPVSLQVMQIIQSDLNSIGFTLEIEQVDQATFESRLIQGDFGAALGQMGGGQLSPARVVQNSLLRTSNNPLWPDGNPPEEYSEGMAALTTEEEEAVRQEAYDQVNRVLVDESWAIATYYIPTLFATHEGVEGFARDHQNALVLANASA